LPGIGARAYLPPLASNTLASTLPTRFPAALGIGHGLRYALRYCIRSSIRRCLSMLRNTGDGNDRRCRYQCLVKEHNRSFRAISVHSASCYILRVAAHALVCRGPRLGAALAAVVRVCAAFMLRSCPLATMSGPCLSCAQKAIGVVYVIVHR